MESSEQRMIRRRSILPSTPEIHHQISSSSFDPLGDSEAYSAEHAGQPAHLQHLSRMSDRFFSELGNRGDMTEPPPTPRLEPTSSSSSAEMTARAFSKLRDSGDNIIESPSTPKPPEDSDGTASSSEADSPLENKNRAKDMINVLHNKTKWLEIPGFSDQDINLLISFVENYVTDVKNLIMKEKDKAKKIIWKKNIQQIQSIEIKALYVWSKSVEYRKCIKKLIDSFEHVKQHKQHQLLPHISNADYRLLNEYLIECKTAGWMNEKDRSLLSLIAMNASNSKFTYEEDQKFHAPNSKSTIYENLKKRASELAEESRKQVKRDNDTHIPQKG